MLSKNASNQGDMKPFRASSTKIHLENNSKKYKNHSSFHNRQRLSLPRIGGITSPSLDGLGQINLNLKLEKFPGMQKR